MSDYINTTFMDKSSWDRIYSTSLEIYDFDKSKIVSESQKFILNAQTTFISMAKDILVGINMYMPQLSNFAQYSNAFSDQILNNESITSSSFNPKILAFCFYSLEIIKNSNYIEGYNIFFDKKKATKTLELVQTYVVTNEFQYRNTSLYDFLKKTGTTPSNLIRYFVFLEKKYPKVPERLV
jgi:hypothetical protein